MKVIKIIRSLSNKQLHSLEKFIKSPYFNQHQKTIDLYEILSDHIHRLHVIPTKQKAHQLLFPDTKYNDQELRLVTSYLNKVIERFLICEEVFQDDTFTKIQLAKSYRKLNLEKHFESAYKQVQKQMAKTPIRNAEFYSNNYHLQLEQYHFTATNKRTEELNLQEISDAIDIHYLALKLRQTCLSLSHQTVFQTDYKFGLLEDVLEYIHEETLTEIPAIAVYYHIYYTMMDPDNEDHFHRFKKILFAEAGKFPESELRDLYLLAINYCIKKLNVGHDIYAAQGLDLYKEGLRTKVLLSNKVLSRFSYNNIVALALKQSAYDWVEQFINEYQNSLEKKYADNAYKFNMARLEYERKNLNKALLQLRYTEFKDLLNNLNAKILLLKIYYELEEHDLLESHLDSMDIFIRRKKVIGYHQKNYRNIIKFTKKLLVLSPYDRKARVELKQSIVDEDTLTEKEWLLSALEVV